MPYCGDHARFLHRVTDAGSSPEISGSDHCPVWLELLAADERLPVSTAGGAGRVFDPHADRSSDASGSESSGATA